MEGQQVVFDYTGYNESGAAIDSSYRQGRPAETRLGIAGLIPGVCGEGGRSKAWGEKDARSCSRALHAVQGREPHACTVALLLGAPGGGWSLCSVPSYRMAAECPEAPDISDMALAHYRLAAAVCCVLITATPPDRTHMDHRL